MYTINLWCEPKFETISLCSCTEISVHPSKLQLSYNCDLKPPSLRVLKSSKRSFKPYTVLKLSVIVINGFQARGNLCDACVALLSYFGNQSLCLTFFSQFLHCECDAGSYSYLKRLNPTAWIAFWLAALTLLWLISSQFGHIQLLVSSISIFNISLAIYKQHKLCR